MIIDYALPTDLPAAKAPELVDYLNQKKDVTACYDIENHRLGIVLPDSTTPDIIFLLGSIVGTKEIILTPILQP